jgi:biotin carboxyl carrier protein
MKSFHEVKAEEAGTVSRFLVENEDAVDAGQDLMELE